ncbi:MAG: ZIP family metal transporter [Candidatus Methanoplasma sp.]|jgi:ZIP family zinc transporter|nr:ZIP family metal transporter [Candidatus Methanoplasma sp.]
MMSWFFEQSPVVQGLLATLFTYAVTALGAAMVFFFKAMNRKALDMMMGFAAGVMMAASFWSLLAPAIDLSAEMGGVSWMVAGIGFLAGGAFVVFSDLVMSRTAKIAARGPSVRRSLLLTSAVTMHNIPEGLAVGVAFGGAAMGADGMTVAAAMALALGIGLQNFPEGACVSLPLRREGYSRLKSFLIGQGSGIVEPVAGVVGVMFAMSVRGALPMALSFSAGAMIAVVCSELIPESFRDSKTIATLGVLAGFAAMMVLDVALG